MGKGDSTRQAILDHAVRRASTDGLEGLSIGSLATELGLSKSGLFAHFQSKDALKVAVIEHAATIFYEAVMLPALAKPRGLPRIREMYSRWTGWAERVGLPGGCVFMAATVELDDQPGPARDALVRIQTDWVDAITKAAEIAVSEGHFASDVDPAQFAFDLYGVMLGYYHSNRLLRNPKALERANRSFDALVERVSAH